MNHPQFLETYCSLLVPTVNNAVYTKLKSFLSILQPREIFTPLLKCLVGMCKEVLLGTWNSMKLDRISSITTYLGSYLLCMGLEAYFIYRIIRGKEEVSPLLNKPIKEAKMGLY